MCILYALLSRYPKKRRTPYHCLFHWPDQFGEPSMTKARCAGVNWLQAVSRGMPASPAWRMRSSWQSFQAGVCNGLMAPLRKVLRSSGITSPMSTPMTRPKPRQVGQAPYAELKLNSAGCGSA
jgi:hypothetical protein